jgi:hypothetical protein
MRDFRWRWISALATAWLALAIGHAVFPAQANAGCIHNWVRSRTVSLSVLDPSFPGASTDVDGANGRSHESRDRLDPCARGECSRPSGLPPAPSIDVSLELDRWIALRPGWAPLSFFSGVFVRVVEQWLPA